MVIKRQARASCVWIEGLDTGDIILCEKTAIGEYETSGQLFERMAEICGKLLTDAVRMIGDGTAEYKKQSEDGVCYAERIRKEESVIDWSRSAAAISKLICGMNPSPLAATTYKGQSVKIEEAEKTKRYKMRYSARRDTWYHKG